MVCACAATGQTPEWDESVEAWQKTVQDANELYGAGDGAAGDQAVQRALLLAAELDDDRLLYSNATFARIPAAAAARLETVQFHSARGWSLLNSGHLGAAEMAFRDAVAVAAKRKPDEKLASAMIELSIFYRRTQRAPATAMVDLLRQALKIREGVFGPEAPESAEVLEMLTAALRAGGSLSEANGLASRAANIRRQLVHEVGAQSTPNFEIEGDVFRPSDCGAEPSSTSSESLRAQSECRMESPRLLHKTSPDYSKSARQFRLTGSVTLALVIDKQGRPGEIELLSSLGLGLDEKAARAVADWRFEPGTKDGEAVPVRATVHVGFNLL